MTIIAAKEKARQLAVAHGHQLGEFETRRYTWGENGPGAIMFSTTECLRCGGTTFANKDGVIEIGGGGCPGHRPWRP